MILHKYGIQNENQLTPLEVELQAFLQNPPAEVGGLGRAEHFWNITTILWPEYLPTGNGNLRKRNPAYFVRHPWAERMVDKFAAYNYVGVSACASAGKTELCATWAIVNWLAAPTETLVFATSTSLKESGKRIWGSIKKYYSGASLEGVGRLVESLHAIRTNDGTGVFNDKYGIYCVAGEKKSEKEAIGKLIGAHTKRTILIADELPELTEALMNAATSNLATNPFFQMIGLGNFKSVYDPFGVFIRPKAGYGTINVEDEEWETELGIALHFDGTKSPNVLLGEDKYPIYNNNNLENHRKTLGDNSAMFWRMCRSFQAPIGIEKTIYTEADIMAGKADQHDVLWKNTPVRVTALDPSFTSGGDRSAQIIGSLGECVDGVVRLKIEKIILLRDNARDKTPRDYQIARKFRDTCVAEGISPSAAAMDTSGAGSVLWSILAEEWSRDVMQVNFAGSPSETYVRANDPKIAKQLFDRRVSELWWVGREFMKYGQIRGVSSDLARELCAREYDTIKGADGLKVSVEKKADMKLRIGFSPDLADSFSVLLELCRQKFNFLAGGVGSGLNSVAKQWDNAVDAANDLYENATYEEMIYASETIAP